MPPLAQKAEVSSDRTISYLVLFAIAAFAALRINLGQFPFWFDEYASLIFADQPISRLWSGWMVAETNPPLFYTLVKGWRALGFTSTLELRLLPELGGLIALALLALAARLGGNLRAALAAVVLAGISPQHIWAAQLLRGYVFALDGVLIAAIGLMLIVKEPVRPLGFTLYAAGSVVAIQFHTTMLLWPPTAMIALAFVSLSGERDWPRSMVRRLVLANLCIALASAWWIKITVDQLSANSQNVGWIPHLSLADYARMIRHSTMLVNEVLAWDRILSIFIASIAAFAAISTIRNGESRLWSAIFVVGAIVFWAASLVHPIATPMTLYWLSAFIVLILAGWIGRMKRWEKGMFTLIVLASIPGFSLVAHGSRMTEQDFASAVSSAAADAEAGLLVEHASFGLVMAKACAHEFPDKPCPVPILTLEAPGGSFADTLPHPKLLRTTDLPTAFSCCKRVFTVRTNEYDPLLHLGIRDASSRRSWNDPFVEGPISVEAFYPALSR